VEVTRRRSFPNRGSRDIDLEYGPLTLDASSFRVESPSLQDLVYPIPPGVTIGVDDQSEEWLEWPMTRMDPDGVLRAAHSPRAGNCLSNFVRLADASTVDVLAFAHAWGPLGVASLHEHLGEAPCLGLRIDPDGLWAVEPDRSMLLAGRREPVSGWRLLAKEAHGILAFASRLADGESVPHHEMWLVDREHPSWTENQVAQQGSDHPDDDGAYGSGRLHPQIFHASHDKLDYLLFHNAIERWFEHGHLGLLKEWPRGAKHLALRVAVDPPSGLPAVLALELAAILSNPIGIHTCDGCGAHYGPSRRPRDDRRRYCAECSLGSRAAKREWWARARARGADHTSSRTGVRNG